MELIEKVLAARKEAAKDHPRDPESQHPDEQRETALLIAQVLAVLEHLDLHKPEPKPEPETETEPPPEPHKPPEAPAASKVTVSEGAKL